MCRDAMLVSRRVLDMVSNGSEVPGPAVGKHPSEPLAGVLSVGFEWSLCNVQGHTRMVTRMDGKVLGKTDGWVGDNARPPVKLFPVAPRRGPSLSPFAWVMKDKGKDTTLPGTVCTCSDPNIRTE